MTMLQNDAEIAALADLFEREGVRSYLEIGSKFGGSLLRVAATMPPGSRFVSVDLPKGTKAWPQSSVALKAAVDGLCRAGHDARIIWGSSQDRAVIDQVRGYGPFDAILLDADHRLQGVTMDWDNYGPMGRLIAFHDIAWHRAQDWVGTRIDVPQFWDSIKGAYRHEEFRFDPTGKNNGIGVLWRSAMR